MHDETDTTEEKVIWVARLNDKSVIASKMTDGTNRKFKDIDQTKLDKIEIWAPTEVEVEPGIIGNKLLPHFSFKFHPDICRLILFWRTVEKISIGKASERERRLFFGYQITTGMIGKKNFQFIWSIGEGALDIRVEDKTGRENLDLNPGEK